MGLKCMFRCSKIFIFVSLILLVNDLSAKDQTVKKSLLDEEELSFIVFWEGINPKMCMADLAAKCAPIFWFSPDEPELKNMSGKNIRIPVAFPFEEQVDAPVVYYQIREILVTKETRENAFIRNDDEPGSSILDLSKISGFNIDYNHYYQFEVGLGKHSHDTEQAQFKIYVHSYQNDSNVVYYKLYLLQTTAKAHALAWYDNIYKVDAGTGKSPSRRGVGP
jgi:hypothetical protein